MFWNHLEFHKKFKNLKKQQQIMANELKILKKLPLNMAA